MIVTTVYYYFTDYQEPHSNICSKYWSQMTLLSVDNDCHRLPFKRIYRDLIRKKIVEKLKSDVIYRDLHFYITLIIFGEKLDLFVLPIHANTVASYKLLAYKRLCWKYISAVILVASEKKTSYKQMNLYTYSRLLIEVPQKKSSAQAAVLENVSTYQVFCIFF